MSSELEVLRQRIIELEAKNAKLEAEKAEIEVRNAKLLKQVMEENVRRDAEIAELKAEVVKLRDNNKENKQQAQDVSLEEVANVHSSTTDQCDKATFPPSCVSDQKPSEDRKMDVFLDEVHKKKVSDGIRQRNKEKKLLLESAQDLSPVTSDLSSETETIISRKMRKL